MLQMQLGKQTGNRARVNHMLLQQYSNSRGCGRVVRQNSNFSAGQNRARFSSDVIRSTLAPVTVQLAPVARWQGFSPINADSNDG